MYFPRIFERIVRMSIMKAFLRSQGCTGILCSALSMMILVGCSADEIKEPEPSLSPGISTSGMVKEFEIPGYIAVGINPGEATSTRDPWTAGFDNGSGNEYELAPGNYHFLLAYDKANDNALPIVFPLSVEKKDYPNNTNITVVIHNAFSATDLGLFMVDKDEFARELQKYDFFFLLNCHLNKDNFRLTDSNQDFSNKTTEEILALLTKNDLLTKALIKDFSIKVNSKTGIMDDNGTEYFTMSSSVYATTIGQTLGYGYTLKSNLSDLIYNSRSDALEGNAALQGYVERLSVKFNVSLNGSPVSSTNNTIRITDEDNKVNIYNGLGYDESSYEIKSTPEFWSIKVLGYAVNALEPESFLIKNLTSTKDYSTNYGKWSWNDNSRFRSFWTEDPHYFNVGNSTNPFSHDDHYPSQFRRALETDTVFAYHNATVSQNSPGEWLITNGYKEDGTLDVNTSNSNYYLNYVSFNDIITSNGFFYPEVLYTHENTFDYEPGAGKWLWNMAPYSAGSHLLVACQMNIDGFEEGADLYYGQNDIFYKNAEEIIDAKLLLFNKIILPGGNSGLRILNADWKNHLPNTVYHGNIEEGWDGGDMGNSGYSDTQGSSDMLNVKGWYVNSILWIGKGTEEWEAKKEDLTLIPAEISGGDGKLMLAPAYKDEELYSFYLAPKDTEGNRDREKSVKINYNNLVSLFHKQLGTIDHFKNGYMYYSGVITHSVTKNENNSWKILGQIGTVRNNWYDINITGINSIGRSVDDPSQPIIPVLDVKRDYLNMTVKILNWHTITQDNIPEYPQNQ